MPDFVVVSPSQRSTPDRLACDLHSASRAVLRCPFIHASHSSANTRRSVFLNHTEQHSDRLGSQSASGRGTNVAITSRSVALAALLFRRCDVETWRVLKRLKAVRMHSPKRQRVRSARWQRNVSSYKSLRPGATPLRRSQASATVPRLAGSASGLAASLLPTQMAACDWRRVHPES